MLQPDVPRDLAALVDSILAGERAPGEPRLPEPEPMPSPSPDPRTFVRNELVCVLCGRGAEAGARKCGVCGFRSLLFERAD